MKEHFEEECPCMSKKKERRWVRVRWWARSFIAEIVGLG
jgi:hypothetical protein